MHEGGSNRPLALSSKPQQAGQSCAKYTHELDGPIISSTVCEELARSPNGILSSNFCTQILVKS
jgi:hypothetical protein